MTIKSVDYRISPIPAGGLEIPLILNFICLRYITHTKMKEFMSTLYSFDYNGNKEDERNESSSDDEEINLLINELSEESQSESEVVILTRKKRKPPLINETREDDRFASDEEYDIVIDKYNIGYLSIYETFF